MASPTYRFGAKEAYVRAHVSDDPASISGPVLGPFFRMNGVQEGSVVNQDKTENLPGDEQVDGTETYLEQAVVTLKCGRKRHAALAAIFNAAHWEQPGLAGGNESHYVVTENSIPNNVQILVRTDRTGKNGADVWMIADKVKFGGDAAKLIGRQFAPNELGGVAQLTQSRQKVVRNGATVYERTIWREIEHDVATAIVAASTDVTAPVWNDASSDPVPLPATNGATGVAKAAGNLTVPMSKELDPNTVNEFTVLLQKNSDHSAIAVTVALNAAKTAIIITHPLLLATTAYDIILKTTIADTLGNRLASEFTLAFTTGA